MGLSYDEDDEDEKDNVLGMLGNEVDDYAGSQIPGSDKGVTVSITVTPNGGGKSEMGGEESADIDGGGDDAMAHILGMCGGGCAMCKGGMS